MQDLSYYLSKYLKELENIIKIDQILEDDDKKKYMAFTKDFTLNNSLKTKQLSNFFSKEALKKNSNENIFNLFTWNETEIAKQLTMIDYHLFLKIQPKGNNF
jgi:hypothetical protein